MLAYEKALKLICLLEHPRPDQLHEETYEEMIGELVAAKFRCVVAAQVYGRNRKSRDLKHRWDARAIELLCCRFVREVRSAKVFSPKYWSSCSTFVLMYCLEFISCCCCFSNTCFVHVFGRSWLNCRAVD